ncbi:uncharacterized protein LOC135709467 [Ochlerotatus camptorhynchus]|uniref:uncharacterized protein LOC135709467 n=1 Tax=Ochlerotatus camptorhynchus TaxID=644619 RepID=UPI0031D315A1
MADSSEPTSMDFCSFVRELNQTAQIDYASPIGGNSSSSSSRNCCPPESRLSQEFENKMQLLLFNYDLDNENDVAMAGIPVLQTVHSETDQDVNDQLPSDSAFPKNIGSHDNSLETTLDNEDDPLELTGEEECDDSGDAGDGGSSDEQQQSRSLSLSYSLSISHAQENFSQYSQSTDKGLSKRYDSPCSYEDDRESECTNFDKLDDWNDFINDMHNNNNNGDSGNRDFKEYYDEYLASKNLQENDDEDEPTEESNTKEETDTIGKTLEDIAKDNSLDSVEESWDYRSDTPAFPRHTSAMDKCRSFLEYRNPSTEIEDDSMDAEGNASSTTADPIQRVPSCKRKFRYDDLDEIEYEVTKVVTEKFLKTDAVPFHGCHVPISQIDDELFAQLVRIESFSTTPTPVNAAEHLNNNEPECSETDDGEKDETESTTATTPTNARNLEQMFQTFEDDAHAGSDVGYQRLPNKSTTNKSAIERISSPFHHLSRSHLAPVANSDSD